MAKLSTWCAFVIPPALHCSNLKMSTHPHVATAIYLSLCLRADVFLLLRQLVAMLVAGGGRFLSSQQSKQTAELET